VRGVAETVPLGAMPPSKMNRIGAGRDRHRLERLCGSEAGALPGQHRRDILLDRDLPNLRPLRIVRVQPDGNVASGQGGGNGEEKKNMKRPGHVARPVRLAIIQDKRRESTIESQRMKSILVVLLAAAAAHAAEFSTGQAARLVIGQRTFTEQAPGAAQDLVGGVSGLAYASDMLFVVDSN